MLRRRLPRERTSTPPVGWKVARPLLSADGTGVGFGGVSTGGDLVYATTDDARCAHGRRHRPPGSRCGCGFHCLHRESDARALAGAAWDGTTGGPALLRVDVLGEYVRHEHGLRYERQRVREVQVAACTCGRPALVLVETGTGRAGWRVLAGSCGPCSTHRPSLAFTVFARLAGPGVSVRADPWPSAPDSTASSVGEPTPGGRTPPAGPRPPFPRLADELSLVKARLARFEGRLERLGGADGHEPVGRTRQANQSN